MGGGKIVNQAQINKLQILINIAGCSNLDEDIPQHASLFSMMSASRNPRGDNNRRYELLVLLQLLEAKTFLPFEDVVYG